MLRSCALLLLAWIAAHLPVQVAAEEATPPQYKQAVLIRVEGDIDSWLEHYVLRKLQRAKHTMYLLDEPTTGLHLADVERLLESLNKLVDAGHSVLLIEHHLDVIKTADHAIDLGPDGGHAGGRVVVSGTPEDVAGCKASHTGRFLKAHLRQ